MVCPFCRAKDSIEGNSVEINDGYASQEVSCRECDAQWQDLYRMCGVCVSFPGPDVQVVDVAPEIEADDEYETRRKRYVEAARRLHHVEGELEIDDNAKLSDSGDGGEYVQAWVWVDADEAGDTQAQEDVA